LRVLTNGRIIFDKAEDWELPDGTVVRIPRGRYGSKRALIRAANRILDKGKGRRRICHDDDTDETSFPRVPSKPIESIYQEDAAKLADEPVDWTPLKLVRPEKQIFLGVKVVLDHCEKTGDPREWSMAQAMYEDFRLNGFERMPPFVEYVTKSYPNLNIPATIRSGIFLPRGV
jgi:hypothetical protein